MEYRRLDPQSVSTPFLISDGINVIHTCNPVMVEMGEELGSWLFLWESRAERQFEGKQATI